jgi:uncharacterized membrane protein YgdD (TMEM256/DUF423 family)
MRSTTWIRTGALLAGLAVALGAFAAHAMRGHYDDAALQTFETAVRYQLVHALAVVVCGVLLDHGRRTGAAAFAFTAGTALFSGSLYALVWSGWRWLGAVTPFGGVLFLVGWTLLAWRGAAGSARAQA